MRLSSLCVLHCVIALSFAFPAAQIAAGTINVIVEIARAVVPGASISVVNKGTGLERTGVGMSAGIECSFPARRPVRHQRATRRV